MKSGKKKQHKNQQQNKKFLLPALSIVLIVIIVIYWLFSADFSQKKNLPAVKNQSPLGQGRLTFISPDSSQKKSILIEIAEDDYTRVKGLMYRETLPENQGMLFIFDDEKIQSFWMKNTPLSLDMLFADADKQIVRIHKYTKPYTTQSYSSGEPSVYVVEVVAGFTDQYGIEPGWFIDWKRFDE